MHRFYALYEVTRKLLLLFYWKIDTRRYRIYPVTITPIKLATITSVLLRQASCLITSRRGNDTTNSIRDNLVITPAFKS